MPKKAKKAAPKAAPKAAKAEGRQEVRVPPEGPAARWAVHGPRCLLAQATEGASGSASYVARRWARARASRSTAPWAWARSCAWSRTRSRSCKVLQRAPKPPPPAPLGSWKQLREGGESRGVAAHDRPKQGLRLQPIDLQPVKGGHGPQTTRTVLHRAPVR
jgi:hypothetical protein